jgi:hypothetical protein
MEFNFKLSFEAWEDIFGCKDVNVAFNIFLNEFLRLFYNTFPKIEIKTTNNRDTRWVTPAIKILCDLKKDYYLLNKQ